MNIFSSTVFIAYSDNTAYPPSRPALHPAERRTFKLCDIFVCHMMLSSIDTGTETCDKHKNYNRNVGINSKFVIMTAPKI